MIINNKLESMHKIYALGLNRFPEQLFKENEHEKVKQFLACYQKQVAFLN